MQLRTKHTAVPAGLSLPPLPLRDTNKSRMVNSTLSPSKSSFPAIPNATVAVVDGNPMVWSTSLPMVKLPRLTTHTPPEKEIVVLAKKEEPQLLPLNLSTPSLDGLPLLFSPPLLKDQFPLLLRLIPLPSKVTPVVS